MVDRMRGNDVDELTQESKCLGCPWDGECKYPDEVCACPWLRGDF